MVPTWAKRVRAESVFRHFCAQIRSAIAIPKLLAAFNQVLSSRISKILLPFLLLTSLLVEQSFQGQKDHNQLVFPPR
jgi:hypothetical protein